MQVEGHLAIQTDAVPPIIMDTDRSVRDVFADVLEPPTLVPIELRIKADGERVCTLTIPVGETKSNVVDGGTLGYLRANCRLGLDIVAVGQTYESAPGRDLTVTVRF